MRFLFHAQSYSSHALNLGLLILRVGTGLMMAFAHGFKKLPPSDQFIGYISSIGFPAPSMSAWMAALFEFGGGIFIAMGLATRLSSFGLAFTMSVAVFMAHVHDPFSKKELGLLYMIVALVLFFTGPGRYSIDAMISRRS